MVEKILEEVQGSEGECRKYLVSFIIHKPFLNFEKLDLVIIDTHFRMIASISISSFMNHFDTS